MGIGGDFASEKTWRKGEPLLQWPMLREVRLSETSTSTMQAYLIVGEVSRQKLLRLRVGNPLSIRVAAVVNSWIDVPFYAASDRKY